jgi:hypothetical protein
VRHAGLTLAEHAGATTRELMVRGCHSTSRAALSYQHAAEERLAGIAERLDTLTDSGSTRTLAAVGDGQPATSVYRG